MAKYLSEELLSEFLNSQYTVYGFCAKHNLHARVLLHTLEIHNIPRPHRKRQYATGHKHSNWKGGRLVDKSGYVLIHKPDHPQSSNAGYVREHRLVMEEYLGRPLLTGESVHHKNHNKSDNRLENLVLFASNSEHLSHELKGKCPNWTEEGKQKLREETLRRKVHGLPQSRLNLVEKELRYLYLDCGLIAEAVAAILSVNHKTVWTYIHSYQIPLPSEKACKRLTLLGVHQLFENPLALKAYEQRSPQFASHLKKLLGTKGRNLSQMELELWQKQGVPRSKRTHKKVL